MRLSFAGITLVFAALAASTSSAFAHEPSRAQSPADVGFLSVTSEPSARIFVDDKDTGLSTPQTRMPLPPGRHRLMLVAPDQKAKKSLGFVITKGEETRLRVSLAQ
jgi:hypothetical protein